MKARGMKQVDLAASVGVTQAAVSAWMRGSVPKAQVMFRIAATLDTEVQQLPGGELTLMDDGMPRQTNRATAFTPAGISGWKIKRLLTQWDSAMKRLVAAEAGLRASVAEMEKLKGEVLGIEIPQAQDGGASEPRQKE